MTTKLRKNVSPKEIFWSQTPKHEGLDFYHISLSLETASMDQRESRSTGKL